MDNLTPKHIAIILDGNGRWAKEKGKPRTYGHKVGFDNIKKIALHASSLNIKALSLYCFSTENWSRPHDEVEFLMNIPLSFEKEIEFYKTNNIKVIVSGRKDRVPNATLKALNHLVEDTKDNTGLILNICFDYGALNDIKTAITEIINSGVKDIDEDTIYHYLSTKDLPKVDILIRTGKEKRLSNYLLLESSYAELFFIDTYWPDFKEEDLDNIINDYYKRERRYGGLK